MKKNKPIKHALSILLFIAVVFLFYGAQEGDKTSNGRLYKVTQVSGKVGDAYRFNINNINMPFNTSGTMADVNIPEDGTLGRFGGIGFLYSGGFMMSGYANGTLWGCAQATASRINNFIPGRAVPQAGDDAQMYVILKTDPAFGQSWQDWVDAVKLGADYYNGDGEAGYDPSDKNGNGIWDMESSPGAGDGEDAPDMLGDATAWCIFNDGVPAAQRERFTGVGPQGIEIRQTVFAFASAGALGNIIFIRYKLSNAGNVAQSLDSVLFAVWADPDVGNHLDDLVGVDVSRDAGFTYQNTPDAQYGINPPCFMIDFFSGPAAYIASGPDSTFTDVNGDGEYTEGVDVPLDTAYIKRGQVLGITVLPGARNLPISSFVHYQQSDPILGDPNTEFEARYYMEGKNKVGEVLDPCTFPLGNVGFPGCETTDPRFWYSGDPVTGVGWLNAVPTDQRQMQNTGPFQLEVGRDVEIVVAYIVGQAPNDAVTGVNVAKEIDDGAQFIFDQNFIAPSAAPPIDVTVESGAEFIDFVFPVSDQVSLENTTEGWDLRFQGINVFTYRTNSTQDIVGGQQNKKLFTSYSLDNFILDVYKENSNTGGIELLYPQGDVLLNKEVYSNPQTSLIRLRITEDPWTGEELVKGKPYYFAFTSYLLNYDALIPKTPGKEFGDVDDYYLSVAAFVGEVENIDKIYSHYDGDPDGGVKLGEELYNPPLPLQPSNKIAGASTGDVLYDIVKKDELQDAQYEVTFFKDSSSVPYKMFWRLTNVLTDTVLQDSSSLYSLDQSLVNLPVTEGFITRVEEQTAKIGEITYEPANSIWYSDFNLSANGSGVLYVGEDLPENGINVGKPPSFVGQKCTQIFASDLRRIELRFGPANVGKAYRWINGYKGGVFSAKLAYSFASSITQADTVGRGPIGNWDNQSNRPNGWVDVPFTAWLVDPNFSTEEIQLAVGFLERRRYIEFTHGTPDGVWDPTEFLIQSGEYIFIFNSPYDPDGGQMEFTGGAWNTPGGPDTVWSDLLKGSPIFAKKIPQDAIGVTQEQRDIFDSPYFNSVYVVGLQRSNENSFFTIGDVLTIPIDIYPYTESDIYSFVTSQSTLSEEGERELWNKVNVFPNPLYGFNTGTSYSNSSADEPFVTFSNLPIEVTVKVYSLSGQLLRTLNQEDKMDPGSPFLRWDLQNESGLRVASGMYFAIVSSPKYGDKVLKFAIIMPQKQIQKY